MGMGGGANLNPSLIWISPSLSAGALRGRSWGVVVRALTCFRHMRRGHAALWPTFLAAKAAGHWVQFNRARLFVNGIRVVPPAT